MNIEGDDLIFATGKRLYANCGIVGLGPDLWPSEGYERKHGSKDAPLPCDQTQGRTPAAISHIQGGDHARRPRHDLRHVGHVTDHATTERVHFKLQPLRRGR